MTISNLGKIVQMKPSTSRQKVVQCLLYSEFKGTQTTRYGIEKEKVAIEELETLLGISVDECGLFVDRDLPFLAVSPDGTFGDRALVNIKCPSSARDMIPDVKKL